MRFKNSFLNLGLVITASFALSACGGSKLEKKSADELIQDASAHLYAADASYNFSSQLKVNTTVENPFASELKINLEGAIDNKAAKYEVNPTLEAGMFNLKLPITFDAKNLVLTIEPSSLVDTLGMFVPQAGPELAKYKNKHVRIQPNNFDLPDEFSEIVTSVQELVSIAGGAMQNYSKNLPASSVQKLSLEAADKNLGAKAKVQLSLNGVQSAKLQEQMNAYLIEQVKANSKINSEFKQGFIAALEDGDFDEAFLKNSTSIILINAKGQPIQSQDTYYLEVEGDGFSLTLITDYSNYAKAKFNIQPTEANIIDLTEEDIARLSLL